MVVSVFCGASPQTSEKYLDLALHVGQLLASSGVGVVFGGGGCGMMGALADGVLDEGGNIIGVLPRFLFEREPPHPDISDMRVVDSMHERKAIMYDLSDAFMVLPGGYGTMDETMEAITWRQLGLHKKRVVFVGVDDFWCGLEATFDTMYASGFLSKADRDLVSFFNSTAMAIDSLTK